MKTIYKSNRCFCANRAEPPRAEKHYIKPKQTQRRIDLCIQEYPKSWLLKSVKPTSKLGKILCWIYYTTTKFRLSRSGADGRFQERAWRSLLGIDKHNRPLCTDFFDRNTVLHSETREIYEEELVCKIMPAFSSLYWTAKNDYSKDKSISFDVLYKEIVDHFNLCSKNGDGDSMESEMKYKK